MPVKLAAGPLLLDVGQFAATCEVTVPADDATAGHVLESEQPYKTHLPLPRLGFEATNVPRAALLWSVDVERGEDGEDAANRTDFRMIRHAVTRECGD